jgi:hypothetical protein
MCSSPSLARYVFLCYHSRRNGGEGGGEQEGGIRRIEGLRKRVDSEGKKNRVRKD